MVCRYPPYGTTSIKWDEVLDYDQMWEQYGRIVKPKGVIGCLVLNHSHTVLICSKLKWFRYELIWNKNKCGSPRLVEYRPMKTHENVNNLLKESGGTYNPQMEKGEPYARKSKNPEGYVGRKNDHGYGMKPRTEFENKGHVIPSLF